MTAPQRFPQKVPLPRNVFDRVNETPLYEAYECCLQNERKAGDNANLLMHARCLGYMMRELPATSRETVAHEIKNCFLQKSSIDELATFYVDHLFRIYHPSRDSLEFRKTLFDVAVDSAPKTHSSAKQSALHRDGYRCMVTGAIDRASFLQMTPDMAQAYTGRTAITQFCHIFPPLTNWGIDPQAENHSKSKYCGNVWSIINGFDETDVLSELSGNNIHRLSNGLTMSAGAHLIFDDLGLWFEEVLDTPNTYTVCTLLPDEICLSSLPPNRRVTFTSTSPHLELPNPKYLKLHAAICRIAHMSGTAAYLDLYDRDLEQIGVMAHDGSSAELLLSRLQRLLLVA